MATKNAVVVGVDVATGEDMTAVVQPMAEPEGGWPADEFTGKGGSYVRDPLTGVRTPTPETAAALAAAALA